MWQEFMNMSLPAIAGSVLTFAGILASNQVKKRRIKFDVETAQDKVWLDIVKQSRIEYELQRKENNRLRYITHHLQTEIQELETKNSELLDEVVSLRMKVKDSHNG